MNHQILIVVSRFNERITQSLLEGALETLYKAGLQKSQIDVLKVPGAFELPVVAARGARSDRWDCVICLGCVIQGETPHFDYVCQETARGLMDISLETEKPVIFGVLTTGTSEQAMQRSGLMASTVHDPAGIKQTVDNKGVDAAQAALDMLGILSNWESSWS